MTEFKVMTDYLYGLCNQKKEEIDSIIGAFHNLLGNLDRVVRAGIVSPEIAEPLTDRLLAELRLLEKIKGMMEEVCKPGFVTSLSDDHVKLRIEKEQSLISSLQNINWLNTDDIHSSILNEYQVFASSLKEEFIPALENDIEQLHHFKDEISMACVYASPEVMSGKSLVIDDSLTYPFIHADLFESTKIRNERCEDNVKYCLYCGEKIADQNDFCSSCGRSNQVTKDPDITVQFCRNCGKDIPLTSKFCPYCGNCIRISSVQSQPGAQEPPMACVYASPDLMAKPKKREGIVSVFFRKKR